MILKYLPICLFAFNTSKAQTTLQPQEQSAPIALAEETLPFASGLSMPESAPEAVAPYYSDGGSSTYFFANGTLGFWNKTMATTNNVSSTGGGTRYGVDLGAQFNLSCRHNGRNLLSASLGYNAVYVRDHYGDKGPAGSVSNEYHVGYVSLPVMFTTTYYGSQKARGVYFRGGATIDYAVSSSGNKKEMEGTINKLGFVPYFGFGMATEFEYESRYTSYDGAVMFGPFVSYNVLNMTNISGSSLRYLTFGFSYTWIVF